MKILLLIPIFILSACTIDWNDEKDAKIAELESQITQIQANNLALINSTRTLTLSGNICDIRLNECLTISKSNAQGIKDLGNEFSLTQTETETMLNYSGKIIKTWSHTPPKNVPFVWDEACTIVWKGFEKLKPEDQNTGKQGVWDALTDTEKTECMKEYYNKSLFVEGVNDRFYKISLSYYEGANSWIFDTKTLNLSDLPANVDKLSILTYETGITIQIDNERGSFKGYILNYDPNFENLTSRKDISW